MCWSTRDLQRLVYTLAEGRVKIVTHVRVSVGPEGEAVRRQPQDSGHLVLAFVLSNSGYDHHLVPCRLDLVHERSRIGYAFSKRRYP